MLQVPDLYDQKSLRMIFDSLFKAQQQADEQREGQQRELAQLKREVVELQSKVKVGKQMYEEVRVQRETIKDLESKLVMSAPQSYHNS